jgi:hypothetical protein
VGLRRGLLLLATGFIAFTFGCGGGGSSSSSSTTSGGGSGTIVASGNNVQPIVVNAGVTSAQHNPPDYLNGVFTTVTICVPGTTNCTSINNVLVDTGSYGLRIVASAIPSGIALPQQHDSSGNLVAECNQFQDGFTWGSIRNADIQLSGEKASNIPMQVIGDSEPLLPTSCSSVGPSEDTVDDLAANGVLGVGPFRQDCGSACTSAFSNPGIYYSCPASGCQIITESLVAQVQNPVWMFSTDNNGVILELPAVSASGQPSATGSMVFGIGTQSNNSLNGATVLTLDVQGNMTTVYHGQSYPQSFLDSGSNGYFFLDSATTGFPLCNSSSDFYCPNIPQTLTATNQGQNGASAPITFNVGNADTLLANPNNFVFNNIAGPNTGAFDFGLPFFFGRNVYTAIELQSTPSGTGPYFAY